MYRWQDSGLGSTTTYFTVCVSIHGARITKESPFFLLYGCDPQLPIESVLGTTKEAYLVDMEDYRSEFVIGLAKAQKLALESIRKAQEKQKGYYDRATESPKYRIGDRAMVYMPGDRGERLEVS